MNRRTTPVAIALAATAALLLTGCGSGGDDTSEGKDKIAGADQGAAKPKKSTEPTESADTNPDGVDLSLPKDMKLVFDWDTPADKDEAAAMDDARHFVRSIYRGVAQQTVRDPAVSAYATDKGLSYARTQIQSRVDAGLTSTGTRRHYQEKTRKSPNGNAVEVSFCVDSSKFYSKEVKSKKVRKGAAGPASYDFFKIVMTKFPGKDDLWRASIVFVTEKAEQCG
ncbi:hypothetical protein [Streptomyces sp. KN37]|uniref:hypothetical protein n=1 Tax=Streptomyces sp. KN37 TaxID=3090667 RepID=UPI002A75DECC|nr:hypothetical protein [Streptomyces sp. KN37]WPO72132.1 hypothetical protein R9806_16565 [Streptomyces sp. KN37]